MAMMGHGIADRGRKSQLLGVVPAGKVTYPGGSEQGTILDGAPLDPNHSLFVIVDSDDWGGETDTLFRLARVVATRAPVVTVLVNGGEVEDLERLVIGQLHRGTVLELAWEQFAEYDTNANLQQERSNAFQRGILVLGVLVTLFAVTKATLNSYVLSPDLAWIDDALHYAIVAVPITLAIVMAASNRFKAGNKWILLRAGAEAIKREVFRYRARADTYRRDESSTAISADERLAREIRSITGQMMKTEVNVGALRPYNGPIPPTMSDDGFSALSPDRYVSLRLCDQLDYFRRTTRKLDRKLKALQWLIYIFGGVGTLLAALGFELWVAVTAALAVSFATYIEYQQTENTLMKYNQAATDLANVHTWWSALPPNDRADPGNVNKLVAHTERTLETEHIGWVQRMHDALEGLRTQHAEGRPTEGA